ncbi:MAG: hypothetical protein RL033_5415, partial [Pseudomonadota bacterium]
WELESGDLLRTFEGHTDSVTSVALSTHGCRAVSGSNDAMLKVWDLESGELLRTLQGHTARVSSVGLSGDGQRALSAADDGTLRLWDVESGKPLRTFAAHTSALTSVAFSGDGRWALSIAYDRTLKLWDLETRPSVTPTPVDACLVSFSGDADMTAVAVDASARYAIAVDALGRIHAFEIRL